MGQHVFCILKAWWKGIVWRQYFSVSYIYHTDKKKSNIQIHYILIFFSFLRMFLQLCMQLFSKHEMCITFFASHLLFLLPLFTAVKIANVTLGVKGRLSLQSVSFSSLCHTLCGWMESHEAVEAIYPPHLWPHWAHSGCLCVDRMSKLHVGSSAAYPPSVYPSLKHKKNTHTHTKC